MKLSELLRKNILEVDFGGILNKFEIKIRRNVLFFEDIFTDYIKNCEDSGYGKEMEEIAHRWGLMGAKTFTPKFLKRITKPLYVAVARKVWKNMNIISEGRIIKENDKFVTFKLKNEFITRVIGKNRFATGFFIGCLEVLYKKKLTSVRISQNSKNWSIYHLKFEDDSPQNITKKSKPIYNNLNKLQKFDIPNLRNAIKENLFQIDKNVIYFRGKRIIILENTIFHLIANNSILMNNVSDISYNFFKKIIDKNSTIEDKLKLLKTILQVMGWGTVKILIQNKKIILNIRSPPYGLQQEKDNWDFIIKTVLGYMRLVNKKFRVEGVKTNYKMLKIIYSL